MRLILLTRAMESSAEVLPALGLLAHHVRTMPAEPTALLNAPACDALLIDGRRDLPAVRGLTRLLRQTGVGVPLILVATEGGLAAIQWDWGMDDVVVDTSSPAEVEARLRLAVSRVQDVAGTATDLPEEIRSGDLHIDEVTYTAKLRNRTLDLTFKEFELLKFLAQHPGRVFTRAVLLQEVWGYDYFGGTRTVDVHVRRLRAKLGIEHEGLIGTVRNVGLPVRAGRHRRHDARLAVRRGRRVRHRSPRRVRRTACLIRLPPSHEQRLPSRGSTTARAGRRGGGGGPHPAHHRPRRPAAAVRARVAAPQAGR